MHIVFAFLAILMTIGMPFFIIFTFKWVLAIVTILTGDKEGLHHFGNLCEKDRLPQYQHYDWRNKWQDYKE